MDNKKNIEIPFGAFDSELGGWEYTIPEGFEAEIKNGKVIVRKVESKSERIRKAIIKHFKVGTEYISFSGFSKGEVINWLEKQGKQEGLKITIDNSIKSVKFPFKARVIKTGKIISIENGQLNDDGKYWKKFSSSREDGFEVYNPEELIQCDCEICLQNKSEITGEQLGNLLSYKQEM